MAGSLSDRFPVLHRCQVIFTFEQPVEVGQVIEAGAHGNFQNSFVCGCKQAGGHCEAVVIQVFNKSRAHMSLEEFHEVGFAVVCQSGHFLNRDSVSIVFFHVF